MYKQIYDMTKLYTEYAFIGKKKKNNKKNEEKNGKR